MNTLQLDQQKESIFTNHYKAHYGYDEYHMIGSSEEQATVRVNDIPSDDCIYSDGTVCNSLAGASFGGFELGS